MNTIDFSCKHDILLEDEEGGLQPMDEPYFRAEAIQSGVWKILSDGDYSYLLEGDDEAFVIDSGYGSGNIREFCQTLTRKPVRRIANTHDHFDHTANNCYFDLCYMSRETQPLAAIPYPSFEGITFPRDYQVQIVGDGDVIPLRGSDLLVFKIPDHAVGSLAFLDKGARTLFSGDELGLPSGKPLTGSVARWAGYMEKLLRYRDDYDAIYGGGGAVDPQIVERYLDNARYILAGHEGAPTGPAPQHDSFGAARQDGRTVWKRRVPHPGDGPADTREGQEFMRVMDHAGCRIIYDVRMVH